MNGRQARAQRREQARAIAAASRRRKVAVRAAWRAWRSSPLFGRPLTLHRHPITYWIALAAFYGGFEAGERSQR